MTQFSRGIARKQRLIGLLDIGSSKIVCLVVALDSRESRSGGVDARVVGIGHRRSRGVKAGVITDVDQAEEAIRACVDQAEHMAGVTLEEVVVSVSCGRLKSRNFAASTNVVHGHVRNSDIGRIHERARSFLESDGRTLVHMNTVGYRLDGAPGASDPRGMAAHRLTADLHAVTADESPVRNLQMLIDRCYLKVAGYVVAPYASGLAVLREEERQLGTTCIDIGGGTTAFAVFIDGSLMFVDSMALGSDHITFDIARELQTPLAEAERIKALYGTLVKARSDDHELFSYSIAGGGDGECNQVSRAQLTQIIRPRVLSMFSLAKERMEQSGFREFAGKRVVLTGGGSELIGVRELAAEVLEADVRVNLPKSIAGMPEDVSSPVFSTVCGMLDASVASGAELVTYHDRDVFPQGYLGRVGQWLKEGL